MTPNQLSSAIKKRLEGQSAPSLAEELHVGERTLYRYLAKETFPKGVNLRKHIVATLGIK